MHSKIILIGGVPGVGKTSISGFLARELGIDIMLSGDYLREFLRPLFGDNPLIQKSVYDAWQAYGQKTDENIVKGYIDQAKIMMAGIDRILIRAIENGENLILETLYFLPEMLSEKARNNVHMFYLYIGDEKLHRDRLVDRINYTHKNSPGTRLAEHLYEYRNIMEYSMMRSSEYNVKIIDTSNYEEARRTILEMIVKGESRYA
ncbi:mevalonate-3-phosphate 5-kinase [Thermoplasma volcanium]|nr:mevalonate-3-phosphate 5-kinase [Thermoplasma volcanium]